MASIRSRLGARANSSAADNASWLVSVGILAVVIPASDKVASNEVFFAAHGVSPLAWVALLVGGLILCWLVVAVLLRFLASRLGARAFDVVATSLMLLVSWFFVGNVLARTVLSGMPVLAPLAGLVIGAAIALAARRFAMGNALMVFATIATAIPLAGTIWGATQSEPPQALAFDDRADRPSVVWVVSDELQYPLAFDDDGRVRPELPNLRSLQDDSTTYTRAYSGANYTDYAVPSMLAGISNVAAQGADRMQEVRANIGIVPSIAAQYSVVMESPIYAFECDDADCASVGTGADDGVISQYLGFAKDTAAIAGRTALAAPFSDLFPSLDGKWRDFWSGGDEFGDNAEGNSVDKAIAGIEQAQAAGPSTPFFAFWHTIRTHAPWVVDRDGKEIYPARLPVVEGAHMVGSDKAGTYSTPELESIERRLYANSAIDFDRQLGKLIDELKATGAYDNTMIVVTADHGAAMTTRMDRRMGDTLQQRWTEVAHIPLVVKAPGQAEPDVVSAPRSTGQIARTVLDAVGAAAPDSLGLSPSLADDLPAPPVFTTIAGGVMTPWEYTGIDEPSPWRAEDLTPPDPDYPYAIGIDQDLLGQPVPAGWTRGVRGQRQRPSGPVGSAAARGPAPDGFVRDDRDDGTGHLGRHRDRLGPVGAGGQRDSGGSGLGHRAKGSCDVLRILVHGRLSGHIAPSTAGSKGTLVPF